MGSDKNPIPSVMEENAPVQHYGYEKNFRTAVPQIIAVSIKNLLLLVYGMTLGFPTILIPAVENPIEGEILHLEKAEISWISSINLIVVPVGCALSGVLTTPIGRKRAMQMVNIPFFIAWLLFHYSTSTGHLYGALFLTGLAGGILEAPVLTYVAEVTQPHLRGALTATSTMAIILGVFTQFLLGTLLYWRTVVLINIAFTVLAVIALCFVPESPHWLVSKKRHDDAKKSLQWLRGWAKPHAVEEELKDIQALYKKKKAANEDLEETLGEKISNYMERGFILPFLLVCYAFFIGHFSGMTTLQTYAVSIFHMLDAPLDKYYATLILGVVQMLGTGLCVILVHYTGKRPLMFVSTAGAAVCSILVASYDGYFINVGTSQPMQSNVSNITADFDDVILKNSYAWMPMTSLLLLAFITHTGIRLLPWILIGEVFNAKTRSGSAGLASAAGYIIGFTTNKMFLSMVDKLSIWGTYTFYAIISSTGCIVLYFILPETEGKKLREIEDHFSGVKRLTNEVYRSKKRPPADVSRMRDFKGNTNLSFEGDNYSYL